MCPHPLQQVYQHQSAQVFRAVCLLRPQQVSVLQQQRFTRHIQARAQVFQRQPH